jgi:1-acyl-sn-glycerol-3-phosphate acyltransferase
MWADLKLSLLAAAARGLAGVNIRWIDFQPDSRQRIYYANHTSHLDAPLIWASLPSEVRALTRPLAASDYWAVNKLRSCLAGKALNSVFIDRNHITLSRNPIDLILEIIGKHDSLILFPEGKRNSGPEVGEFKSGLYYLSKRRPQLELVPVFIDNLNRILPKGEFLPVPLLSTIIFGPTIHLFDDEPKTAFLARARQTLCNLKYS